MTQQNKIHLTEMLSITTLSIMLHNNGTQHINHHYDTQHSEFQYNNTQRNDFQYFTLRISHSNINHST